MTEIVEQSPEDLRRTMHGAPLWARSATVAAGPAFNFAMSILVFGLIFLTQGVNQRTFDRWRVASFARNRAGIAGWR